MLNCQLRNCVARDFFGQQETTLGLRTFVKRSPSFYGNNVLNTTHVNYGIFRFCHIDDSSKPKGLGNDRNLHARRVLHC